jgi:hypothetical protein
LTDFNVEYSTLLRVPVIARLSMAEGVGMVVEAPRRDGTGAKTAHTDFKSGGRTWSNADMALLLLVAQVGREVGELKVLARLGLSL